VNGPTGRLPRPVNVTLPAVSVMAKVLEKAVNLPIGDVLVKLPDSVKVPGNGPVAVPLTEKLKAPAPPFGVQVPVSVDPMTLLLVKVSPSRMRACASAAPGPSTPTARQPVANNKRRPPRAPALSTTALMTSSCRFPRANTAPEAPTARRRILIPAQATEQT